MTPHETLIEKYIEGTLSPAERKQVDALLENDDSFKKELAFHTNLQHTVKQQDDKNFKDLLSSFETETPQNTSSNPIFKWIAAASIVLLLGLAYTFYNSGLTTNDDLFAEYFEPYRNIVKPIERNGTPLTEDAIAFEAYENQDFETASQLFAEQYAKTKASYNLFYEANAQLQLGNAKQALHLLLEHKKTSDKLSDKTAWYIALAYLKLEQNQEAKRELQAIIAANAFKAKEAQVLLEQM